MNCDYFSEQKKARMYYIHAHLSVGIIFLEVFQEKLYLRNKKDHAKLSIAIGTNR